MLSVTVAAAAAVTAVLPASRCRELASMRRKAAAAAGGQQVAGSRSAGSSRSCGISPGNGVRFAERVVVPRRPVITGNAASGSYKRHEPQQTLLYQVVSEQLEPFLAAARAEGRGLPRYVETELRQYLECGVLEHGFARAVCNACGEEIVVAFSCKRRGVCASCNVRRMCSTAVHLRARPPRRASEVMLPQRAAASPSFARGLWSSFHVRSST